MFIGTLNQSIIHSREVFADVITDRAASIIVTHNHPSGIPEPSSKDISITERLTKAENLLSIELLDHIILNKNGYYSFSDNGLL